jgi:hypothetical protein
MGIKLDWEVESEGGWNEVGEDAAAVAARARRTRQVRTILLGIGGLGLIVAAIIGYRLYAVGQQLRADLNAVIAAETLALRLGDRAAYLNIQQDVGSWRDFQGQRFEQYQADAERLTVEGNIVHVDISADQARVEIEESLDSDAYHVLWFYLHTEEGWKHIPPAPAFWGEQKRSVTPHVEFYFYEEDSKLVENLTIKVNAWWEAACRLTGCVQMPKRITIRIEPDPLAKFGWTAYNAETIRIPSPLLGRFKPDGALDPVLEAQLAHLIAERWATFVVGTDVPQDYSDLAWMRDEVGLWLQYGFNQTGGGAPILGPVVDTYGTDKLPRLIASLQEGHELVASLQQITGVSVAELPVEWSSYLTYRLRGEVDLLKKDQRNEAGLLYGDPERGTAQVPLPPSSLSLAEPADIEVVSTHTFRDIVWAEVTFFANAVDDQTTGTWRTYEAFRLVNGRWVHTIPQQQDWGAPLEIKGQSATIQYFEIDSALVADSLPVIDQTWSQIAADLGANPADHPLLVLIVPPGGAAAGTGTVQVVERLPRQLPSVQAAGEQIQVTLPSTMDVIIPTGQSDADYLVTGTTISMIEKLVDFYSVGFDAGTPLQEALVRWEMQRFGLTEKSLPPGSATGDAALGLEQAGQPPETIERIWADNYAFGNYPTRDYLAARALIDLLGERYGHQAISALVQKIGPANSVDEWLQLSIGIRAADIQADWHARTIILINAAK